MISRIFFGLLAIGVGIIGLKYNFLVSNTFPRLQFFEQNLGAGSSYGIYKLLCIILVIGGVLFITGFGTGIIAWLLAPIAGLFPK